MAALRSILAAVLLCAQAFSVRAADEDPVPWGVSFGAVFGLEAPAPDRVEVYGELDVQRREFWLHEAGAARPLVVLVHGGCWLDAYGVEHARALAAALRDAGHVVMAPEYRRLGDAGGGWPASFRDVLAAFAGLAGREAELGFDPARVAVVGHSAGGHLALLTGLELAAAEGFSPALVVGLAAITDPVAYALGDGSCNVATPRFFGGMPDEAPGAYGHGSPLQRLRGGALTPPVILVQGDADTIVPPAQASALAEASADVELELVIGAQHFDLIHPRSAAFERLLAVLERGLAP
ncbi:MAG: alpha/beta hydrolase [Pseudomonadales bacterium]|jgi:acetyl esterase/lipase|nr:alpha/beta hydrolase [Pseudomonadales bacterium]